MSKLAHLLLPMVICLLLADIDAEQEPMSLPETFPVRHALQAILDVPLDTARSKVGTPVFASVDTAWVGPSCVLNAGATLSGHVLDVATRTMSHGESRLTVAFDRADCNGEHSVPVAITLIGVIDRVDEEESMRIRDPAGLFGKVTPRPEPGAKGPRPDPIVEEPARGGTQRYGQTDFTGATHQNPRLQNSIKIGQVVSDGDISMEAGTGPEGSSVLRSRQKNIRINKRATLILVAQSFATVPEGKDAHMAPFAEVTRIAKADSAPLSPSGVLPLRLAAPTEVCSANCSVVGESGESSVDAQRSVGLAVSLERWGYRPRIPMHLYHSDHETTATYLSADQLLLTFSKRQLRQRVAGSTRPRLLRTVRAILIDAHTHAVLRVMDWQVEGEDRYLWQAGPGRVLVHIPGAVQAYGPNLEPLYSVAAPSAVRWVTSAPNGSTVAIGLLRERYTAADLRTIQESLEVDPEEDVDALMLDGNGKLLRTSRLTTSTVPSTLTDDGEVLVRSSAGTRWDVEEQRPDGSRRTITKVTSLYPPTVSASRYGLFLSGSDGPGAWYRLVRFDGHTVLQGRTSGDGIERGLAAGSAGLFALRIVEVSQPPKPTVGVPTDETRDEVIEVRRTENGRRIFQMHLRAFPPSSEGYAVSPDGSELAVLTATGLSFYSLPK